MVVAKESSAASRPEEYTSYLHLLTSNGKDITELVRSALGDTAASTFDQIWSAHNDYLVNYTIGLVTHNKSKSDAAIGALRGTFVRLFSHFLSTTTQIPLDPIAQLATEQVLELKGMIDDQIAQNYPKMYADLRVVYAQASRIGDALAPRIAQKFPDKFPGNPSSKAVDLRVSMNTLLQEHLYLATMTTSAATGGRSAEQAEAAGALAANADALGTLFSGLFGAPVGTSFDQMWAAKNLATIAYASASTSAAKQTALGRLNDGFVTQFSSLVQDATGMASGTLRPVVAAQVEATITALDDQRSRSWARLGADDRAAAAVMEPVADMIAAATVTKLRSRFPA